MRNRALMGCMVHSAGAAEGGNKSTMSVHAATSDATHAVPHQLFQWK